MKKISLFVLIILFLFVTYASIRTMKLLTFIALIPALLSGGGNDTIKTTAPPKDRCGNVVGVCKSGDTYCHNYVFDQHLYDFRCDTLAQVKFWRQIMNLHKDSALINLGHNRTVVEKTNTRAWSCKNDNAKQCYRDSIRQVHGLDSASRVL